MSTKQTYLIPVFSLVLSVFGCSSSEPESEGAAQDSTPTTQESDSFEAQVAEYIQSFSYQETHNYSLQYTGGDPAKFNVWVPGGEPVLVKAGDDIVVRSNNDTYYIGAFLYLGEGPVVVEANAPTKDRFYSFQMMDDNNVNFRNIIHPDGEYTFYFGEKPEQIRGEAVEVPSVIAVLAGRVEVKDKNDPEDVAAANAVYYGLRIDGAPPTEYPQLDLLSKYPTDVIEEANRRIDETFSSNPISQLILRHDEELGVDVSYLEHAAVTKEAWAGPVPSHSSYEVIFFDEDGDEMMGSNGTYTVTTEDPPVDAFWSITVYDTERGGFLHPNDDDRYHINNTGAIRNDDGTVTFMFKQNCETPDMNCLAVPAGRFDVTSRYYLPHEEIITGEWTLPQIVLQED